MELKSLQKRPKTERYPKALKLFHKFEKLIDELSHKTLPDEVIELINHEIHELNNSLAKEKTYHKDLKIAYDHILKLLRKQLKIVPKHYYRNLWLTVGMSSIGLPIGVAFGLAFDNMAFLGLGLPIGMSIGMIIGAGMDNKAKDKDKQIDIDI